MLLQITLAKYDQKTMDENMRYIRAYFPLREGEDEYGGHHFLNPSTNEQEWTITFKLEKDPEWNQIGWLSLHQRGAMIANYKCLPDDPPSLNLEHAAKGVQEVADFLTETFPETSEHIDKLERVSQYLTSLASWQCALCQKVCCDECSFLYGETRYCNECHP